MFKTTTNAFCLLNKLESVLSIGRRFSYNVLHKSDTVVVAGHKWQMVNYLPLRPGLWHLARCAATMAR